MNAPIAGEQPTCFVIGPIGNRNAEIGTEERARFEESIQVWEKVIEPGCRAVGLEPIRADLIARAGEIPEQIFRSLRDADAVVADLSGGNPNVMYELGLRHSKSKVTIQIGEAGCLPFDVAAIRTIEFRRTDGSLFEARDALTEVLREGLAGRFDLVTATRVWLGVDVEEEREPTEESQEDEELGFLELLANMEEQLPQVVITLQSIAGTSQELTDVMNAVAGEVTASDEAGGGARARLVIAIRFADQLADFAARTEALANTYEQQMQAIDPGVNYILGELEQHVELRDEVRDFPASLAALGPILEEFAGSTEHNASVTADLGRIARPLGEPSRRLAASLRAIGRASVAAQNWATRGSRLLDEMDEHREG